LSLTPPGSIWSVIAVRRGEAFVPLSSERFEGEAITLEDAAQPASAATRVRHWPGEGSVGVERAVVLGAYGQDRAVFEAGRTLVLQIEVRARRRGRFNLVAGATLARLDGVAITNLVSPLFPLEFEVGERRWLGVTLESLLLGDGQYVFSKSIFEGTV
jgi:hypothetical protein